MAAVKEQSISDRLRALHALQLIDSKMGEIAMPVGFGTKPKIKEKSCADKDIAWSVGLKTRAVTVRAVLV